MYINTKIFKHKLSAEKTVEELKIAKDLRRSNFAKNTMIVSAGTAFAQGMGIIFSPIITRIYTPEEYGLLAVFSSITALLVVFSSLRYQVAIPIADNDEGDVPPNN